MKKILVIIFLIFSFMAFSESFEYSITSNESRIGTSTVNFDEFKFNENTLTELQIGKTFVKYESYTQYNESWYFKNYKLDIFVNGYKQGTLISKYDNGMIISTFNGSKLKNIKIKDPIILDNNIIGHFFIFNKMNNLKNKNIKLFIPSLLLSPRTEKYVIIDSDFTESDSFYKLKTLNSVLEIKFNDKTLESVFDTIKKVKIFLNGKDMKKNVLEKEITFKSNNFTLYGSLMYPQKLKQKNPAVILIHGSGPNDRDETLVINKKIYKPFLEISKELSKNGFIVLRYDKRSYTILQKKLKNFDNLSVKDFVDDARAGIDFLNTLDEVDKNNIFILGHSQGASFLPLIIKNKNIKGAIAISPGLLNIFDQMEYQLKYQLDYIKALKNDEKYKQTIDLIEKYLEEIEDANKKFKDDSLKNDDVILGQKAKVFIDWVKFQPDPYKDIFSINIPLLILNGTQDLKTPKELLESKESSLKENKNITIEYLENTTHEMLNNITMNFNDEIIKNILNWVNNLN
ncbi:hypothetical protein OSSY52_18010 [Tepiditoga spiralis]|uniref:Serine aminopeptidase S33 domain-containing protein n=1 Tax=Tepiditoga spiralis TaxID=2108365 RepID=A0A7G1G528_9BACT|nr:alpha/beta hydrolase [Tepiditoga spiralis]BBE31660.1 hypothetical protein OSSY52_18010 [Tepiditoga spiralis]